jgi:DNA processing protein
MLIHWVALSLTEGIGPIFVRRLVEVAGSVEGACGAGAGLLRQVEGIGPGRAAKVAESLRGAMGLAEVEMERAGKAGARIICQEDESYSELLKTIPDPPLVLYVKGTLEPRDLNAVAIVGSRKCSFYGREQAERFGALLGGAGVTVLSGGARGIDSAAHRGALSHAQGRTIAVLGCGVNVVYPPENASLFGQISERGAIVSEYAMDTPPLAENFPKRNRIVSGLSRGVLVVEADERSGALITARQAGEDQGRPVFALPGRVDNQLSVGPHQLIRDGAVLVTGLEDILEGLGPVPEGALREKVGGDEGVGGDTSGSSEYLRTGVWSGVGDGGGSGSDVGGGVEGGRESVIRFTGTQQVIVEQLSAEAVGIDVLMDRTGLEASVLMRELTFLSLKGAVKRVEGQRYKRV